MGNHHKSLSRGNRDFIVFGKTPGVIKPGKSTLHNPTPRKFLPFVRLDFLRYINAQAQLLMDIGYKSASISGVRAESLNGRIVLFRSFSAKDSRLCIVDISGMDNDRQYIPKHIYNDVPLASFCFFLRQSLALHWQPLFLRFGNQ